MSKLEQLIQELCPNGVEYKKIKNCFKRLKGTPITAGKMKEIENENGEIRVFAGGKTVINAKEEDIPNANITRVPAVLVQSRGVIDVVYFESPFTFKNEMWAYTNEEKETVKYLYYVLKNNIQSFRDSASGMGSLPQISLPVTENFIIPLPPLEIQREIVRILDNFTELTAELTLELTARKKQYEYYRDQLLTFGDEVEWKALGEVCTVHAGGTPSKNEIDYWENGTIKWLGSTVCKNKKNVDEITNYITELGLLKSSAKLMKKDTTLIALVGATIGKVAFLPFEATINQNIVGIYPVNDKKNLPSYIYYACTMLYSKFLDLGNGKLAMANLSFVRGIKIPLPSLTEQQRIVDNLDRFDILCNDINQGLPAEIEARKKQYEYYRNMLLTFPKTELEV